MQNQVPGWVKALAAGPTYCALGQHSVQANTIIWHYYVSPTHSRQTVCGACAEAVR